MTSHIPPWQRRIGGRLQQVPIEVSATCCPPMLTGRPAYNRLPGENGGFQVAPTSDPVVIVGERGADFLNSTGSATGILGYPVKYDVALSEFTLLFDGLYPREFSRVSLRFPPNVVRGYVIADFFGQVYVQLDSSIEAQECGKLSYTSVVLYEFSTDDNYITNIQDYRVFNNTNLPVAAWFLEYFDDIFQEKREEIEVFFDDYLNPSTAGHFAIPCDAEVRAAYDPPRFRQVRDLWDHEYVAAEITETQIIELHYYAFVSHTILDWLAQHFGFVEPIWATGYRIYAPPGSDRFYLSLGQKRAILRNAFNYDQVVEENTGELYQYPFSNFPGQQLWSITNWRGINFAKGSIQVLNFILDTYGLHGVAPREPVQLPDSPEQTTIFTWNTDPNTFSAHDIEWQEVSSETIPGTDGGYRAASVEAYFVSSQNDYIVPLRPTVLYDCIVDGELYPSFTYNLAIVGRTYVKEPGSAQAIYRVPLYWERGGPEWKLLTNAFEHFGNAATLVGYQWFLPSISLPGDPLFNYDQCELLDEETFINGENYVIADFFAAPVDVAAVFGPEFNYEILIQPPVDTIYNYMIDGTTVSAMVPNDGNFYRYINRTQQVVKIIFTSKQSLRQYTRWIRV